jgi:hypothetical protein
MVKLFINLLFGYGQLFIDLIFITIMSVRWCDIQSLICKFCTCMSDVNPRIEGVEGMGLHFTCNVPEPNLISYYNPCCLIP